MMNICDEKSLNYGYEEDSEYYKTFRDYLWDFRMAILDFDHNGAQLIVEEIKNILYNNSKEENKQLYEDFYEIDCDSPIYYIYIEVLKPFYECVIYKYAYTDIDFDTINKHIMDLIKLFIAYDFPIIRETKEFYSIVSDIYEFMYFELKHNYYEYITLLITSLVDSIATYKLDIWDSHVTDCKDVEYCNRVIVELIIDADDDILTELHKNKNEMIEILLKYNYQFDTELDLAECWTSLHEAVAQNVDYETIDIFLDTLSLDTILQKTASGEDIFHTMERCNYKDKALLTKRINEIQIGIIQNEIEDCDSDSGLDPDSENTVKRKGCFSKLMNI